MMGVELYLHGATITRWLRPDGVAALDVHEEQLQASMEAWARTPSSGIGPALRGAGLKLQFPVARENSIMPYEDGFASRLPWEVVSAVSRGQEGCPGEVEGLVVFPHWVWYLQIQKIQPGLLDVDAHDGQSHRTSAG
jgi:hypothetical protein